jgi:hypothetical protein
MFAVESNLFGHSPVFTNNEVAIAVSNLSEKNMLAVSEQGLQEDEHMYRQYHAVPDMIDKAKLRNNELDRDKTKCIISEFNTDASSRPCSTDDTDDELHVPVERASNVCAVLQCDENIFIACHKCPATMCYGHVDTNYIEHARIMDEVHVESSSGESEINSKRSRKRTFVRSNFADEVIDQKSNSDESDIKLTKPEKRERQRRLKMTL